MMRSRVVDAAVPAALLVLPSVTVLALADAAREHDGVASHVDPTIATDMAGVRTPALTTAAKLLTLIGSEAVVGALALLMLIFLLERRGAFLACVAAATMATSAALTVAVKLLVERARPGAVDRLGPVDASYSFPSGHTLNSAVFLGLVALLLVPMIGSLSRRIAAVIGMTVLAFGIGLSRVYLGYHWASDVAASWLIAIALLALVRVVVDTSGPGSIRLRRSGRDQVGAPSVTA
jgi:membrane-associated phospholipid phosphatase